MKDISFTYDEKTHKGKLVVEDKLGRKFIGEATCAAEDLDFESQLTSYNLCEQKATIAALTCYKNDLKISIELLEHLVANAAYKGDAFNHTDWLLNRKLKQLKGDLEEVKHELAVLKMELRNYINDKDTLYSKTRERRQAESIKEDAKED